MITFLKDFIFIQDLKVHIQHLHAHCLGYTESCWTIYEKEKVIVSFFSFLFDFLSVLFLSIAFIHTIKHTSLIVFELNNP